MSHASNEVSGAPPAALHPKAGKSPGAKPGKFPDQSKAPHVAEGLLVVGQEPPAPVFGENNPGD